MNYQQAIAELRESFKIDVQRSKFDFRFGTKIECKEQFISAFQAVDNTIEKYMHLPEYDQVIEWMTETKGKGLLLTGSCGRGKSIIVTGVLPLIFYTKLNKILKYYRAEEIPKKIDEICKSWAVVIDELGVETQVNNYGEKSEGFNTIINMAETKIAPLFISTNLTPAAILSRYGERTLDRISRLCLMINFSGESLRK
jgi:DNA replication protein DnaC